MNKFLAAGMLLSLLTGAVGCSSPQSNASDSAQPQDAKAKIVLKAEQSAYPYLVLENEGTGPAENVQVTEAKSGEEASPMVYLKQESRGTTTMKPASEPLTLLAADGVQYQIRSKDVLDYSIAWTEGERKFSKRVTMKAPQKIETH